MVAPHAPPRREAPREVSPRIALVRPALAEAPPPTPASQRRGRPRVAAGGEEHALRFCWHGRLGEVEVARIRVAPTLAAMLRCVAAALSRRSRDLPQRWVARRLFWRESGEEIRSACAAPPRAPPH